MSETNHQKLRGIVEDLHEEMMRSLVDAPAPERVPKRAPLETRLAEQGFDGSVAVATSFRGACTRMLANGDRSAGGMTAPAAGLTLLRVIY